jgi:hypothetical protein
VCLLLFLNRKTENHSVYIDYVVTGCGGLGEWSREVDRFITDIGEKGSANPERSATATAWGKRGASSQATRPSVWDELLFVVLLECAMRLETTTDYPRQQPKGRVLPSTCG